MKPLHSSLHLQIITCTISSANGELILLVVLYGYETVSFILREDYRLKKFGNRMLGRLFGSERGNKRTVEKIT
jgi:hypothetical protein